MTDPQQFFQQAAHLGRRAEPRHAATARSRPTAPPAGGNNGGRNTTLAVVGQPDRPALPDDAAAGRATSRSSCSSDRSCRARKANQLSSFIVARNRRRELREARARTRSPTTLVAPSPAQAASLDRGRSATSARRSRCSTSAARRWCAATSSSSRSATSIFYVRPIYVEGQGEGQFPRLRFVAVRVRRQRGARRLRRRRPGPDGCGRDPPAARAARPRRRRSPAAAATAPRRRRPATTATTTTTGAEPPTTTPPTATTSQLLAAGRPTSSTPADAALGGRRPRRATRRTSTQAADRSSTRRVEPRPASTDDHDRRPPTTPRPDAVIPARAGIVRGRRGLLLST